VSALYDAAAARRSGSLGLTVAAVGALAGIGVVWLLADDAPAGPRPAAGAGSGGAVLGLAVEW